jgi:long-chain acyl-CoA synthetase
MADASTGLVSGARCLSPDALDARVRRVATGLAALGVAPGQCVAILMRNDIAFMESAYAAQSLGAYAVPINWHFKAEEIGYILADCGARVLIGHADLLAPIAAELPAGITLIAASTPPRRKVMPVRPTMSASSMRSWRTSSSSS